MVVEDEDALRNIMARMIEKQGYKVLSAENGLIGLEIYEKNRGEIKAVISDMVSFAGK